MALDSRLRGSDGAGGWIAACAAMTDWADVAAGPLPPPVPAERRLAAEEEALGGRGQESLLVRGAEEIRVVAD